MKASMILSIVGLFAASAAASPASTDAALKKECGSLGVMKLDISEMEGVDPTQIRHCAEHPLGGQGPSKDMAERDISEVDSHDETGLVDLSARSCYTGSLLGGCYQGYCWKKCDVLTSGHWCWTAFNNGAGAWHTCTTDIQCILTEACGAGNCKSCGCSC